MTEPHQRSRLELCAGSDQFAAAIDWPGTDPCFIFLNLSRREIERGLIGDAVDRLMVLSDSPENTRRFADSLFVQVGGYDNDARELYQIPEVLRFVRGISAMWPYWFHFCDKEHGTLAVVMRLLADIEMISRLQGETQAQVTDVTQVRDRMLELFAGMNALYAFHGISHAENIAMTDQVMQALADYLQ